MAPAVPGPVEITKFWEGSIRAGFRDHTLEIVQTGADRNLAYVLSSWTVKKVGGGPNNNTRAYIGTEVTESAGLFGLSASVQLAGSPETLFGLLGIARASETTNA
jgi:hypothetical protein